MLGLYGAFYETALSPVEQQIVALTASRLNECHYCMAAHSTMAEKGNIDGEIIKNLRGGEPLADKKLQALAEFTRKVVDQRGHVADGCIKAFLDAGYTKAQMLDVIMAVALKTFTNYANHIMHTPVDDMFSGQAWGGAEQDGDACKVSCCG